MVHVCRSSNRRVLTSIRVGPLAPRSPAAQTPGPTAPATTDVPNNFLREISHIIASQSISVSNNRHYVACNPLWQARSLRRSRPDGIWHYKPDTIILWRGDPDPYNGRMTKYQRIGLRVGISTTVGVLVAAIAIVVAWRNIGDMEQVRPEQWATRQAIVEIEEMVQRLP